MRMWDGGQGSPVQGLRKNSRIMLGVLGWLRIQELMIDGRCRGRVTASPGCDPPARAALRSPCAFTLMAYQNNFNNTNTYGNSSTHPTVVLVNTSSHPPHWFTSFSFLAILAMLLSLWDVMAMSAQRRGSHVACVGTRVPSAGEICVGCALGSVKRPRIGFVLECRAVPAGGTRDYASSEVNEEGTFRGGRVSLNADRWERVELAQFCPPKRLFAAVPSLPASGR